MAGQVRARAASFKIEITGNEDQKHVFKAKLQHIRTILGTKMDKTVTTRDVLNAAMDTWISLNDPLNQRHPRPQQYIEVEENKTDEKIFLATESSLQNLIDTCEQHNAYCKDRLKVNKMVYRGHVATASVECENQTSKHKLKWSSSPHLPNKQYLVNHRVQHGYACSGMLPSHYERFVKGAGMGYITCRKRKQFKQTHTDCIKDVYKDSIEEALHEEIGSYEELDGINIMTDARHGWRKNAKDSSIVAIGEKTHKVLNCCHITKQDDIVSQRHELKGTEKVYDYFAESDVTIKVHTHDRNLSVNKLIKGTLTQNQNDVWHGVKSVKKAMKNITTGPQYKKGQTWFEDISDKLEPVRACCNPL